MKGKKALVIGAAGGIGAAVVRALRAQGVAVGVADRDVTGIEAEAHLPGNLLDAAYADGLPDFEEKYFAMLSAGGSKHHKELLAPFGLDASDPKFWDKGLSMIAGFIDELEAMEG